ncbi:hypothetical protein POG22_07680 [Geitlerinema sp. CS-897]|uniref:hypothetical protein n=1 Tax=Baaleninema simplex TaxID=2862350 RepID=UPI00034C098F|nr:hypothetical protein [Baaleninema simplex]MDC0832889.1 hypothetical protein [Geitlerinema sp. CS-897]
MNDIFRNLKAIAGVGLVVAVTLPFVRYVAEGRWLRGDRDRDPTPSQSRPEEGLQTPQSDFAIPSSPTATDIDESSETAVPQFPSPTPSPIPSPTATPSPTVRSQPENEIPALW